MLDARMTTTPSARRPPATAAPRLVRERLGVWRERLVLPNGREVLVRPIEPADADALRASFRALSPEEIRLRFQAPLREMSADMARQLATVDPAVGFALAVTEPLPPGEALIGAVVRASIVPNTRRAEFAIIVGRPLAGQGLGLYLMRRLIHWCRARRLEALFGDVLVENVAMLKLADALGFERRHIPGDHGLVRIELNLRQKHATQAEAAPAAPDADATSTRGLETGG
jgi:RimJ/RimL family protein N-acetyltransferase